MSTTACGLSQFNGHPDSPIHLQYASTQYTGSLLLETPWHQPLVKQEPPPDEAATDSGISPTSCRSDEPRSSPLYPPPGKPNSPHDRPRTAPQLQELAAPSPTQPAGPLPPPEKQPVDENSVSSGSSGSDHDNSYYDGSSEDPLRRLQLMALHRTPMLSRPGDSPIEAKSLQCPLCTFTSNSRSQFNHHLSTHDVQKTCTLCHFTAETVDKLGEHLREAHDMLMSPPEDECVGWGDEEEPGVTVPKVNSQGKVKTFRCKQCNFAAVTKLQFWDHTRSHIKVERQLTCPKCPFVTEYKHHLEYHLRNHFGSKPFKCDQCSYSCVNKSMLNSHLKSHSNVYQFRCANCTYATKYCHSLKLHLRKYGHAPAMVLNPDGSPNPLPIVDVYGAKRGPKQRSKREEKQQQAVATNYPMFSTPFDFMPGQGLPYYNNLMNSLPTNLLLPAFPSQQGYKGMERVESENVALYYTNNNNNNNNLEGAKEYRVLQQCEPAQVFEEKSGALDLTLSEPNDGEASAQETPVSGAKNRRKGKAFKLERIAMRLQHQSSGDEEEAKIKVPKMDMQETAALVNQAEPKSSSVKSPCAAVCDARKVEAKALKQEEVYDCSYCDITFRDIVMYTMHMSYHCYQDPFTCNNCGQQTADKVAFFLHIARTSHS